tara:strand:- start:64 stop:1104 length:1041 start_codon:yes stop_codon:yes gene_type:complete
MISEIVSLITGIIIFIYLKNIYNTNKEEFTNTEYKKDHIFISIASYRDDECPKTIKSIFENAKNPKNIFIGICQQNKKGDIDCLLNEYKDNIRIKRLEYTEAKGPTYARYICSTLCKNEEYFLQIDSHTDFVKDWDSIIIDLYHKCPSSKTVITHYPPSKTDKTNLLSYMCKSSFNSEKIPTFESALIKDPKKNLLSPYIAGGMLFVKSEFLKEVPYDPHLPYLFQGEEILLSARLWTNGYDFYLPRKNICKHSYTRNDKPKFWNDIKSYNKIQKKSLLRVKYYLGWVKEKDITDKSILINKEKYGLGNKRSIEDYLKFAGIDIKRQVNENYCSKFILAKQDFIIS